MNPSPTNQKLKSVGLNVHPEPIAAAIADPHRRPALLRQHPRPGHARKRLTQGEGPRPATCTRPPHRPRPLPSSPWPDFCALANSGPSRSTQRRRIPIMERDGPLVAVLDPVRVLRVGRNRGEDRK